MEIVEAVSNSAGNDAIPTIVTELVSTIVPEIVSTPLSCGISQQPPADTLSKEEEITVIHSNALSTSSSYVIDPKPAKKEKQPKIKNSVSERPQTARERLKKSAEVKPDVKYPHKLGRVPKYILERKEQSAGTSKCSLASKTDDGRPKTADLSMIELQKVSSKVQFILRPSKEVQGDVKSEKSQMSISAKPQKVIESRSKIPLLTKDNEALKLECEKLKTNLNDINEQLKSKVARIKSLEMQVARYQKEIKQNVDLADKQLNFEAEISNLKKNIENLNGRLKIKDEVINRLKNDMEKLNNELKMQTSSYETLSMEKTHLQTIVESLKKEKRDESNEQSSLVSEIVALNEQLKGKCDEIVELKKKNESLNEENDNLKSKSISSSRASINTEMMKLQDKFHILMNTEEKLTQEVHKLQSLLDDEKNANISNETLLGIRADYIKTLQEADNINKIRLANQAQQILSIKKEVKEFEKFKAAHAEEKKNFENMLNEMNEKIIKLKTEKSMIQKRLEQKIYKYQNVIEKGH